jgi:hypothetical protein
VITAGQQRETAFVVAGRSRDRSGTGGDVLSSWAEKLSGRAGERARGMVRFAFYGRVSSEDWQDPVTSRARQLQQALMLAAGVGVPSWLRLVHTSAGAGDGFEGLAEVVWERMGGGAGLPSGLYLDGGIGGRFDEFPDGAACRGLNPPADGAPRADRRHLCPGAHRALERIARDCSQRPRDRDGGAYRTHPRTLTRAVGGHRVVLSVDEGAHLGSVSHGGGDAVAQLLDAVAVGVRQYVEQYLGGVEAASRLAQHDGGRSAQRVAAGLE